MGMSQLDPSIGGLLKSLGYATGQFGKNHVGDRNETLPTVNGFDEFFGNLYHLNAEEEPELPDYPKDPAYRAKFGPRGVLEVQGDRRGRPDGRSALRQGRQADDRGHRRAHQEADGDDRRRDLGRGHRLHEAAARGGQAVLLLVQRARACTCARTSAPSIAAATQHGDSEYIDGMIEHDDTIGTLLKALDDMGIADNTIVVYTSDNGPHMNTWPDGAMTPFRSEKNTNWEGAFRVPCLVRWPGTIKPGTVTNELMSHNDWIPTLCAIAGEPDIVGKCSRRATRPTASPTRCTSTATTSRKFLHDGRAAPSATNNGVKSARDKFFYSDDDGLLVAMRQGDYKYVFAEQRAPGHDGRLGRAVHHAAAAEDLQPHAGSVRAGGHHVQHLSGTGSSTTSAECTGMDEVTSSLTTFKEFPPRLDPAELQPGEHPGETRSARSKPSRSWSGRFRCSPIQRRNPN